MQNYPQPDEPDETSTDTPSQNGDNAMEGETALLPSSILAGKEFKPGQEVVLKIVALHGDQVEVSYAPPPAKPPGQEEDEEAPPEEDGEAGGDTGEMGAAQNRLSSMGSLGS